MTWLRDHTGPEARRHIDKLVDTLAIRGADIEQLRREKAALVREQSNLEAEVNWQGRRQVLPEELGW